MSLCTHLSEQRDGIAFKLDSGNLKKSDFQSFLETTNETLTVSESNLQKAAKLIQSFKQVAVDQSFDEKRMVSLNSISNEILISMRHLLKKSNHQAR